ncbi:MAG: pyruvate dehydrogenase complex dihydrolipoamide acetyltransferase, partial [Bosea sp. 32-68-6]
MPTNILMPALSPTMEKGNLAKWLKKEGDAIKSGDIIAEIETDKATMEVEAVDEGILAKIVVPEGTADVAVNEIIGVIAGEGEDVKAAAAPKAAEAPKTEAPKTAPAAAAPAAAPAAAIASPGERPFASPLARRLAREAGLDLSKVQGSGPHGRIVEKDVEAAKTGGGAKAAPAAAPATAAPASAPKPAAAPLATGPS